MRPRVESQFVIASLLLLLAPGIAKTDESESTKRVAESPIVRFNQMRVISRQFTGQKTDREGVSRNLRLLPQPIYRDASDNSQVLDGALFVFVQGTDPEILLLVEAEVNEPPK